MEYPVRSMLNARINRRQNSAESRDARRFYDSNRYGVSEIYDRQSEREIEHTTRFKRITRTIDEPVVLPRRDLKPRAACRSYPTNFYFYL